MTNSEHPYGVDVDEEGRLCSDCETGASLGICDSMFHKSATEPGICPNRGSKLARIFITHMVLVQHWWRSPFGAIDATGPCQPDI